ncbi:hypothetical protein [Arthrobacter livingstonensis]|uniref:hypothetical protein n=1 Tax=Arthrobacter livingstonensis TaxID=670078 RepID=UPI0011B5E4DB|nr:hypothetical protein [Arthrobacter livingstonensis]
MEFVCRPTSKGPNLPTRYLWADDAQESPADGGSFLMRDVFGRTDLATRCVGFIRNVAPSPDAGFGYPSPWAHVPVYLVTGEAQPVVDGDWFSAERGLAGLSERH